MGLIFIFFFSFSLVSRISNKTILLDQASEVTRAYQKLEALFDARHENRTYRKLFKVYFHFVYFVGSVEFPSLYPPPYRPWKINKVSSPICLFT